VKRKFSLARGRLFFAAAAGEWCGGSKGRDHGKIVFVFTMFAQL
jgi:hypothetical protein